MIRDEETTTTYINGPGPDVTAPATFERGLAEIYNVQSNGQVSVRGERNGNLVSRQRVFVDADRRSTVVLAPGPRGALE